MHDVMLINIKLAIQGGGGLFQLPCCTLANVGITLRTAFEREAFIGAAPHISVRKVDISEGITEYWEISTIDGGWTKMTVAWK